jgi:DNA-nicking Smr family endonuclease
VDEALTRAAPFPRRDDADRPPRGSHHPRARDRQLRRALTAFFKEHPLVSSVELARTEHGGGGVTVVSLKE